MAKGVKNAFLFHEVFAIALFQWWFVCAVLYSTCLRLDNVLADETGSRHGDRDGNTEKNRDRNIQIGNKKRMPRHTDRERKRERATEIEKERPNSSIFHFNFSDCNKN